MSRSITKWLLSAAIMLLVVIFLVSCTEEETTDEDAEREEIIVLTMWDVSATAEEARVITPIIERWNTENPNVQIRREGFDNESYKIKIKTAIAANEAPDLFFSWGAGFSQPFVDAGKVLALDGYLSDEVKNNALDGVLTNSIYNGNIYALPYNMWFGVFYCNTELFEQYNIKLPDTYDELLHAVREFRKHGVGPIGVGVNDRWTAMFYHNILALRTAGADLCNDALNQRARFDEPEFLEAVQRLDELVKAGAFIDGHLGLGWDDMRELFKQGQIPMMFQGTWLTGELEMDDCPVKGKVVARKFPVIEGASGTGTEYLGGSVDVFMVSANTKHKNEAVRALEYICQFLSEDGFTEGIGLPVYKGGADLSQMDRLTVQASKLVEDSTGFVLAWDTFLVGADAQLHLNLVQEIFAGVLTPESFVEKMQNINE